MPRVFSGIQPSGELHVGNYLGAVRNWVQLQDRFETYICIVDLHAITQPFNPAEMSTRTLEMATGLLAAGIDPGKATLFVQSHVPEHVELMWAFNAVAPLGELERMTQFKDKSEKLESINAGLLNYPVLQAADVLLYLADRVPVGEDQLQHLELMREIARRWNHRFGVQYFPEPEPMLTDAPRIMGLDGAAKMSKSLGNTIGLLESPEAIWEKLRPAMTDPARVTKKDPGTPEKCNVFMSFHRYFTPPEVQREVREKCTGAQWGCIDCKKTVHAHLVETLAPIRQRAEALTARPDDVRDILAAGARKCREVAGRTMAEVNRQLGFLPAKR